MKYCTKCGAQINDNAMFCPNCGERVDGNNNMYGNAGYSQQGYAQQPYAQQNYSQQTYYNAQPAAVDDKNSTGLNIISFLIPLVGLILYLVNNDKKPVMAKGCGKWALIGFIVGIVSSVILYIITLSSVFY